MGQVNCIKLVVPPNLELGFRLCTLLLRLSQPPHRLLLPLVPFPLDDPVGELVARDGAVRVQLQVVQLLLHLPCLRVGPFNPLRRERDRDLHVAATSCSIESILFQPRYHTGVC
jgi:hypothetical protein